jgi:DNA repair protein RecO (recombination protein O)
MEWVEEGIVLAARRHGESAAIIELLTRTHGRHLGLVHGGASRRMKPLLQPGNTLAATWRARIADQLGSFHVDLAVARAGGLMHDPLALAGLSAACAMASTVLPEREPHGPAYEGLLLVLDHLDQPDIWPALFVRWEAGLLQELGFGLDLTACAATGATDDLIYVSPRSGRAVSRTAGMPYRDRMLPLPAFLLGQAVGPEPVAALRDGFRLTRYFLERHVLEPHDRRMPPARERMVAMLMRPVNPSVPGQPIPSPMVS